MARVTEYSWFHKGAGEKSPRGAGVSGDTKGGHITPGPDSWRCRGHTALVRIFEKGELRSSCGNEGGQEVSVVVVKVTARALHFLDPR